MCEADSWEVVSILDDLVREGEQLYLVEWKDTVVCKKKFSALQAKYRQEMLRVTVARDVVTVGWLPTWLPWRDLVSNCDEILRAYVPENEKLETAEKVKHNCLAQYDFNSVFKVVFVKILLLIWLRRFLNQFCFNYLRFVATCSQNQNSFRSLKFYEELSADNWFCGVNWRTFF